MTAGLERGRSNSPKRSCVCVCWGVGILFPEGRRGQQAKHNRESLEEEVVSAWASKGGDSLDAQGENRRATAGKTAQTGPVACLGQGLSGEYATWSLQSGERENESLSVMSDSLQPHGHTVHGILQARILEWVAFSFSSGSS